MASSEDTNRTSMTYMTHLRSIALAGVRLIEEKTRTYGPSWKRRRGPGAWFTTVRPWDRLETIVDRHDGDVFAAIEAQPMGEDGSALACIRDMRNYLLLIEAEMVARGVVLGPDEAGEEDMTSLRTTLARMFGSGRPHHVERIVRNDTQQMTLAVHFAPPHHHSVYQKQQECQEAILTAALTEEDVQRLTDAARNHNGRLEPSTEVTQDTEPTVGRLGAGAVHDGCYTTLDLGRSAGLWHVGLGAIPSPWPGPSEPLFHALCILGEAAEKAQSVGHLVASRVLDNGDYQVLLRIPRRRPDANED